MTMAAAFDVTRYQDPLVIQHVLLTAKTIAIVGLSSNTLRASHFVGFYLRRHGWTEAETFTIGTAVFDGSFSPGKAFTIAELLAGVNPKNLLLSLR